MVVRCENIPTKKKTGNGYIINKKQSEEIKKRQRRDTRNDHQKSRGQYMANGMVALIQQPVTVKVNIIIDTNEKNGYKTCIDDIVGQPAQWLLRLRLDAATDTRCRLCGDRRTIACLCYIRQIVADRASEKEKSDKRKARSFSGIEILKQIAKPT